VVFTEIRDRRGRGILSIRNQGTVPVLQRKRLMTMVQLFLVHRYEADAVHYVTPTEDNENLARGMERAGILSHVYTEVGSIIVADVDAERVSALAQPDHVNLQKLIQRARRPTPDA
jgi:isocitrate lyase